MGVPKAKVGTVIAGRYRLVAPLSRGGMGSVWRAEHLALGSPIAIKLIDGSLVEHDEPRARFEQEARAAAALRSPHVVQILDHGVDRGLPFIAMELLDGESLGARLHRMGKLPPAQIARVFQDVARAMRKAHDLGIVHRDLKPDNIFLVKNDDQEIAKVLDFGIAKAREPFGEWKGGTRTGALIGTPQYMSPEQAQGMPVDARTDLWALGVIAFECVCGTPPFPSEKPGELILQICAKPLPIPSRLTRVPPRFDAWFARACDREVDARFQSAKELADALAEVLGAAVAPADVSGGFAALPVAAPPQAAPPPPRDVPASPPRVQVVVAQPAPLPAEAPAAQAGRTPAGTELPLGGAGQSPAHAPYAGAGQSPVHAPYAGAGQSPAHAPYAGAGQSPVHAPYAGAGQSPAGPSPGMSPTLASSGPVFAPMAAAAPRPAHVAPAGTPLVADETGELRSGTMNGGAVVDSDPSTLLRVAPARSRKRVVAALAVAVAAASFGVVWVAARGPSVSAAGGDAGSGPSLAGTGTVATATLTPADPAPLGAGAPGASSSASSATATSSAAPAGSSTSSARPGILTSPRTSGTLAGSATPKSSTGPQGTARPAGSTTNSRIGF